MKFMAVITAVVLIFLAERVLNAGFGLETAIFPVFAVFYLVAAEEIYQSATIFLIAAFFYGFFSGFNPFFFLLVAGLTFAGLILARKIFSLETNRWPQTTIFSLIFLFEFFALFAIKIPLTAIVSVLPVILFESVLLITFFHFSRRWYGLL